MREAQDPVYRVTQLSTLYSHRELKNISEHDMPNLEADEIQQLNTIVGHIHTYSLSKSVDAFVNLIHFLFTLRKNPSITTNHVRFSDYWSVSIAGANKKVLCSGLLHISVKETLLCNLTWSNDRVGICL